MTGPSQPYTTAFFPGRLLHLIVSVGGSGWKTQCGVTTRRDKVAKLKDRTAAEVLEAGGGDSPDTAATLCHECFGTGFFYYLAREAVR